MDPGGRISGQNPAFKDSELVFGLVAPVGTHFDTFESVLERKIERFQYTLQRIRVSRLMARFDPGEVATASGSAEFVRIMRGMHEGNRLRMRSGKGEFLALAAAAEIMNRRGDQGFKPRTAYVVRSLKHPDEVRALRRIYGTGFFLIAITASKQRRRGYLQNDKLCTATEVDELLRRDEHEEDPEYVDDGRNFGQRTRDTFQLADAFLNLADERSVERFLDLVFGCPFHTPSKDEHAMFLAYAAALRSADLSRQVGAVLVSEQSDVIGLGTNDVPKGGGGLYWPQDRSDARDFVRGYDSNERRRDRIVHEILSLIGPKDDPQWLDSARVKLRGSELMDITEYGRPVHAEMEALLASARSGVSPTGATLYCTTFPCHNCAKHLIASGVCRVVYVEPYPKSQAAELFPDSMRLRDHESDDVCESWESKKVCFEPFVGVGPRRFMDLFSLALSSGTTAKQRKKRGGEKASWTPENAVAWTPLWPNSYLDREALALAELYEGSEKPLEKNK